MTARHEVRDRVLGMFLSEFTNGIDAKGRVSVPAEFRAVVAREAVGCIYVWRSFNGDFLEGGGQSLIEDFATKIETMDPYDDNRLAFERVIFGGAKALNFDSTGRVVLPREFADHAGLDGRAMFVGLNRRFEIWNPDVYAARHARDFEVAHDNKRTLGRPLPPEGGTS